MKNFKFSISALLIIVYLCFTSIVFSRPPDPPAKISFSQLQAEPLEMKLENGNLIFPVEIDLLNIEDEKVLRDFEEGFSLIAVISDPEDTKMKKRPVFSKFFPYTPDKEKQSLMVDISDVPRGDTKLELSIELANKKGIIDRKIIYIRSEREGSVILFTPKQYNYDRQNKKWQLFKNSIRENPDDIDVRLLWDDTEKISGEDIVPIIPPEEFLSVRPTGPSDGLKEYINEEQDVSWDKTDPLTIKGKLTFKDFDGVWRPLVNVSVNIYDEDTGVDDHLGVTGTDGNGNWSFTCNNDDGWLQDGRDIYYKFKLENTRLRVQDCGPWPDVTYSWKSSVHSNLSDGAVVDFGSETGSTNKGSMIIWSFLNRAWQHVVSTGGQDPGFVDCCFPENNTQWDRYWEEVDIESQYTDGPDVVMHEYGHAVMWYAYGESNPSPGGSHNFSDTNQNTSLAWSEGWATGFMLSVCPDGLYNWHEGSSESAGEYPSCGVQNDWGWPIEAASSSNRDGSRSEARVAAAINDMLDSHNDSPGTNANLGRTDREDANSSNRVSLKKMVKDVLWGSYHKEFLNFWNELSGELSGNTLSLAREACQYNYMSISDPIVICVASKITTANTPNQETLLDGLRLFRDNALKNNFNGRNLMQTYYKNSPELAVILLKDEEARRGALEIIQYFSKIGGMISTNENQRELLLRDGPFIDDKMVVLIHDVLNRIEEKAGDDLKADCFELRQLLNSVQGYTFRQIQMRMSQKDVIKHYRSKNIVVPSEVTEESKESLRKLNNRQEDKNQY
ncbi:hypothetical protein JXQ31_15530 [candidate division KSB1 bacterium]|nr:hypothetical protein [candidate division KSB1 bacterium]